MKIHRNHNIFKPDPQTKFRDQAVLFRHDSLLRQDSLLRKMLLRKKLTSALLQASTPSGFLILSPERASQVIALEWLPAELEFEGLRHKGRPKAANDPDGPMKYARLA